MLWWFSEFNGGLQQGGGEPASSASLLPCFSIGHGQAFVCVLKLWYLVGGV